MAEAKRGIKIYRAEDAVRLEDTDFMRRGGMSTETRTALEAVAKGNTAEHSQLRVLVRQTDDEGGFSLIHSWFKPNFPLPRHSHDTDCMYYVISGSAIMGRQLLEAGDSFFVPAGAPYVYSSGPSGVEVLEIRRGVQDFDITVFDAPAARWESMAAMFADNQGGWSSLRVAPTMASRSEGPSGSSS